MGQDFFSILLAREGHQVTGIDLTPDMIGYAKVLAAEERADCKFQVMDAEHLDYADEEFDLVISRNLTWTLPEADKAYAEWVRVLKEGGILLNLDANYGGSDFADTTELPDNHAHHQIGDEMMQECEEIKRQLPISSYVRPAWDLEILGKIGITSFTIDLGISGRIYQEKDEFYNPTPMFLICGKKRQDKKREMKKYIVRRFLQLIPILIGITLLSFLLMHTAAADAIDVMEANTGGVLSEEAKEQARRELGLDRPLLVQYAVWLQNVLSGDMGKSYVSGEPVYSAFVSKLPATIYLTLTSIFVTVLISVPLGILAAVRQNRFVDYLIRFLVSSEIHFPNFFCILAADLFFALKLGWFPVMGNSQGWKSVILPTLTLVLSMASKYTRQVRLRFWRRWIKIMYLGQGHGESGKREFYISAY